MNSRCCSVMKARGSALPLWNALKNIFTAFSLHPICHLCQCRSHSTMWRHPEIEFWELGYVDQNSLNRNFDISNRIVTSWTNTTCSHARLSHACARCWWESSNNTEHVNNCVFRSGKFTQSVPRLFLTSISSSGWSVRQQSKKDDLAREEWNQI